MPKLIGGVFLLVLLLSTSTPFAEEYPTVASYRLDVMFVPDQAFMEARAEIDFRADAEMSEQIAFFLHGELFVDSIFQGDVPLKFEQGPVFYDYDYSHVATRVTVTPGSLDPQIPLTVFYQGYFNPSKARSPSDYMRIDPTGVYLRAYYYSPWFPIFEAPEDKGYMVSFDRVTLRGPAAFSAVCVGNKLSEEIEGDIRVTTWRAEDVHLSQAQCSLQKSERLTHGGVTVYSWPDSASMAAAELIVRFVSDMAENFSERYNRAAEAVELHVVEMPQYGDISSDNVTTITSDAWRQFDHETFPQRFLAHELVHPFVRVPIAPDDPLIALVVEGFPSYFHLPVLEASLGREWYDNFLIAREDRYLKMKNSGLDRRGNPLPIEKPLDQITFDEIGDYKDLFILSDRALFFLHWLRESMGDDRYARFTAELFNLAELSNQSFRDLGASYLPGSAADIERWLSTNEYPERLRLKR